MPFIYLYHGDLYSYLWKSQARILDQPVLLSLASAARSKDQNLFSRLFMGEATSELVR